MKKEKSKWLIIILQLLCGGIFGFGIGKVIILNYRDDMTIMSIAIIFIALILAFFIQLVVHEAGHLIFGLLSGYSFVSFRIASYMWIKENNQILFKRFSLVGTGGQCLLAPPPYNDGHYSIILYNLGGVLMNLIISLLCLCLFFAFNTIPFISPLLCLLAFIGIYLALVNGIPLKIGGINNDGFNALKTSKDPISKKAFWITLKINQFNTQNIRLKDISDEFFLDLEPQEIKNDITSALLVANFQRAIDQHNFNKAESILHFINENHIPILGIHQNILTNDYIYCSLISKDDIDIQSLYTKEFKQYIKAMKKFPSVIRTQYTYELLYNKDEVEAQKHLDYFNQIIKSYPYQCDIDSETELINYAYQIYK